MVSNDCTIDGLAYKSLTCKTLAPLANSELSFKGFGAIDYIGELSTLAQRLALFYS